MTTGLAVNGQVIADHVPGRKPRRWRIAAGVCAGVLVLAGAAAVTVPRLLHRGEVCGSDALQDRAIGGLVSFADWLSRNHVPGYVGEVGWPSGPDGDRWAALADSWYSAADQIGLPVTAWAAASWPADYPMAVYRRATGSTALNAAGPQSRVLRSHPSTGKFLRGVVLAGGSFGAADSNTGFSSRATGRYGYDYSYENAAGYRFLASQGVQLVRLTLSWERLQPVPGGPLNAVELGRVRTALGQAQRAGLAVILDLHNYGSFAAGTATGSRKLLLGSPDLPISQLADFWSRLAAATRDEPAVTGFDVLNEPITLAAKAAAGARLWEQASQAAVDAIRATGSTVTIAVAGYGQTAPASIAEFHPRAWITDPANRTVYETHAYFDADSSGHYAATYDAELAPLTGAAGSGTCHTVPDLSSSPVTFAVP
jgi:hypothetical protein